MSEKTAERVIPILFVVFVAVLFLIVGLTVPALPGFERKVTPPAESAVTTAAAGSTGTATATTNTEFSGKLCLNTATKEQLMEIKGIGETFAARIIAYREQNGGFTNVEQLKEISGIGEKRYAAWAPYFTV